MVCHMSQTPFGEQIARKGWSVDYIVSPCMESIYLSLLGAIASRLVMSETFDFGWSTVD